MLEPVRRAIHNAIVDNPAHLKGEAIASRMLISKSTLYAYGESDAEGEARKSISLERFVQFALVTEDGRPLTELCALAGYACIRMPSHVSGTDEPAAIKALHDFSAFMETHAKALMDGRIEQSEVVQIKKRADAAMLAISQVVKLASMQLKAKGGS